MQNYTTYSTERLKSVLKTKDWVMGQKKLKIVEENRKIGVLENQIMVVKAIIEDRGK